MLLYGVCYSLGRFFTEGLRTDSLCIGPYTADGSCVAIRLFVAMSRTRGTKSTLSATDVRR